MALVCIYFMLFNFKSEMRNRIKGVIQSPLFGKQKKKRNFSTSLGNSHWIVAKYDLPELIEKLRKNYQKIR